VFQCSSASRKFLNDADAPPDKPRPAVSVLFSEPKIPQYASLYRNVSVSSTFQCSSASRKFLNKGSKRHMSDLIACFSALQRAENSSIGGRLKKSHIKNWVSVLFSEPKIPQLRILAVLLVR